MPQPTDWITQHAPAWIIKEDDPTRTFARTIAAVIVVIGAAMIVGAFGSRLL